MFKNKLFSNDFSKDFLYNLGVVTLFIFAMYFAYAVLKGSGEGMQRLLKSNNIIEGMGNKQREEYVDKMEKKYEKLIEKTKKELSNEKMKPMIDSMVDKDEIEGFEDTKNYVLKIAKFNLELNFNTLIEGMANKNRIDVNSKDFIKKRDEILKMHDFIKFLENYEGIDSSDILE